MVSERRKAMIRALIQTLKHNGMWDKIGPIYVMAEPDADAAVLNWKMPTVGTA